MSYRRFGPLVCAAALLALPVLLYGAKGAFESNTNNVVDWLPRSFEETARLFWFVERFGSDEILVVSWPGCTLDDARLEQFAEELLKPVAEAPDGTMEPLFRRVFSGRETLESMTSPPLNLTREEALERMQGWLVGPDGRTTCAVALVSWAGIFNRHDAVDVVYSAAAHCGIPAEDLFVGGSTRDSVAIDRASEQWLLELIALSVFSGLFIAWVFLKKTHFVTSVMVTAVIAWSASLSLVYYTGENMDATLLMMPGLVFVLAVSGSVHLTNYYCDAVDKGHWIEAPTQAIRWGWLPCLLACSTTAIGLGSLAVSQVTPIRKFGIFSALGVLLVLAALLSVWPATMQFFTARAARQQGGDGRRKTRERKKMSVSKLQPPACSLDGRLRATWWQPLFHFVTRRHHLVKLSALLVMIVMSVGVCRVRTSAKLEDLFPPESDLIQSYSWLQDKIGPLVPVEVVLSFDRPDAGESGLLVERAGLVERLRQRIEGMENIGGTIAASTFAPPIPSGQGVRDVARRGVLARRLPDYRQRFIELRYLHEDRKQQLWRISARAEALKNLDYGALLQKLEQEVDTFLEDERSQSGGHVSAKICGAVPLVYMAQEQLLRDLIKSFIIAFGLIGLAMAALMGSVRAGLLSMIPNVFPALLVFGVLGLSGTGVDIGAMMTASAAMGIAVDDTIHYLVWFRRGASAGESRRNAIRFAFAHCATPMAQTTIICGLGLLAFAFSPFAPVARFAWLMVILLSAALVGDLLLLPALLAGRLGKYFLPRSSVLQTAAVSHHNALPTGQPGIEGAAAEVSPGREV